MYYFARIFLCLSLALKALCADINTNRKLLFYKSIWT